MSDDTRLLELHSAHLRNPEKSIPEVCRDWPELVPDLQRLIEADRAVDRIIQAVAEPKGGRERNGSGRADPEDSGCVEPGATDAYVPQARETPSPPRQRPLPAIPGYDILAVLGRGGMGIVYLARQRSLDRMVALKMIRSGELACDGERERFRKEAEAVACLSHPNIVQVFEVGEHDGLPFFSLELCEGGNLAQRLKDSALTAAESAGLARALAQALTHAHQHHLVHRDIKPGNVLQKADGTWKLADFGLAKRLDVSAHTQTGAFLGTLPYAAPEQVRGQTREVGAAADVYALGAILYECLTGRTPFDDPDPLKVMQQVVEAEPIRPRQLNRAVPKDLETVCLKCLQKEPRSRYASAAELAEDLRRYLAGESIQAALPLPKMIPPRPDAEFQSYWGLMLWFAFVVGAIHLAKHFLLGEKVDYLSVRCADALQLLLMGAGVWFFRQNNLWPRTKADRLVWSVWIGYIVALGLIGAQTRIRFGWEAVYDQANYPYYAVAAGLAFFVLGWNYWGLMYAFAAAFIALAFVMHLDLKWAVLEFGGLWSVTLVLIAFRLSRLGKPRTDMGDSATKP